VSGPIVRRDLTTLPTMVGQKVTLPLYLVAPAADVPDRVHVTGMEIAIFTVPDVDVTEIRTFVTRDLKRAFEAYFETVHVVDSEAQLPATPHVRGNVKLSSLRYDRRVSAGHDGGQHNEIFGALEWGFGLRVAGDNEFVYSFAERTSSKDGMKGFGDTSEITDTFQQALQHLLADYAKNGARPTLARANGGASPVAN
jgi:hypothetical protein